jgi:hypothetical protein
MAAPAGLVPIHPHMLRLLAYAISTPPLRLDPRR